MNTASKKVIYAALVGNACIACMKFFAAFTTRSSALFAEGIHSLVDTGNQVLLLHGIKQSQKPPDKYFPFGHGKEIYFWSFVVAILIFALGAGLSITAGVKHILNPTIMVNPNLNYLILIGAMIFEGFALYIAIKEFRKQKGKQGYLLAVRKGKDPSLFVVLFEDSAAMLGLIIAFIGVYITHVTSNPIYDGIASVLIGLILGITAVWLAYETKGLLIGESADPSTVASITTLAKEYKEIEYVNEVLTMHMGPNYILVNISLDFQNDIPAGSVEQITHSLDKKIKANYPDIKRIFIEAEARFVKPTI